jgi:menaquinone-dependent protoporphyrinogen oxidase
MRTLIVYASKHGFTEKAAEILAGGIEGEVELMNVKKEKSKNLEPYDTVIIGGSIHVGKMNQLVSEYAEKNCDELEKKHIGFFISCMDEIEKAKIYMQEAFPEELLQKAFAKGYFGGEFNFERMSHLEKLMVKKISQIDKTISKANYKNMASFINLANSLCQ